MDVSNRDSINFDTDKPIREFRVKRVSRFIVTDWASYNSGASVQTIAERDNVHQANAIAIAFGAQHPGSLVNGMDPDVVADFEAGRVAPLAAS